MGSGELLRFDRKSSRLGWLWHGVSGTIQDAAASTKGVQSTIRYARSPSSGHQKAQQEWWFGRRNLHSQWDWVSSCCQRSSQHHGALRSLLSWRTRRSRGASTGALVHRDVAVLCWRSLWLPRGQWRHAGTRSCDADVVPAECPNSSAQIRGCTSRRKSREHLVPGRWWPQFVATVVYFSWF